MIPVLSLESPSGNSDFHDSGRAIVSAMVMVERGREAIFFKNRT
jgi:hypothetical protein